jgi:hypothetical protein
VIRVDVSVITECGHPTEKSVISLWAPRWIFVAVGTFSNAPDIGASSESSLFSVTFAVYDFLTAYSQFLQMGEGGGVTSSISNNVQIWRRDEMAMYTNNGIQINARPLSRVGPQ